ncbi:MAG: hypothetical protein ACO3EP_04630, partial [Phycisphaerales bacterium]
MDQGPDEPVKCSLPPGSAEAIARPLAVDLDGTLLRSDLMWEGLARVALRRPWRLPSIAASLLGGRAAFKARV